MLATPGTLGAQEATVPAPVPTTGRLAVASPTRQQVLSLQPLWAVVGVWAGEFERRLTPTMTVGVGGTSWDYGMPGEDMPGDEDTDGEFGMASADLKLRWYPSGKALEGFAVEVQGGYASLRYVGASDGGERDEVKLAGPTLGVALNYGVLPGGSRRFYLGYGVGFKRRMFRVGEISGLGISHPTLRFSAGYAF